MKKKLKLWDISGQDRQKIGQIDSIFQTVYCWHRSHNPSIELLFKKSIESAEKSLNDGFPKSAKQKIELARHFQSILKKGV